jgi:hypothetical protein
LNVGRTRISSKHESIWETRGQCAFPFIIVLKDFVSSD